MNGDEPIPDGEMWPCFVGSGECLAPAAFWIDDGAGGRVCICARHRIEFELVERMLDRRPELVEPLRKAIEKYE